ncbi:MAG: anaerobic ribonucleoside-triphosphate reductase [Spirochaetota bacterium]
MNRLEQIDARIAELQKQRDDVQGTPTEIYTRIVGYYRSLKNWNRGKREEYRHRVTFRRFDPASDVRKHRLSLSGPGVFANESAVAEESESSPKLQKSGASKQSSYLYFYRANCPNCPPVKEFLRQQDIEGVAIDVDTDEGVAQAIKYQVLSTPTVILLDTTGGVQAKLGNLRQLREEFHAPAGIG